MTREGLDNAITSSGPYGIFFLHSWFITLLTKFHIVAPRSLYNSSVDFQAISLTPGSQGVKISKSITSCTDTGHVVLPIRGAIYYGNGHFVFCILSPAGKIWYHDGIETKRQCVHEGYLVDYTEDNLRCKGVKKCVGIIYVLGDVLLCPMFLLITNTPSPLYIPPHRH